MSNSDISIIYGIYIALCAALSQQGVELANDILLGFANDPQTPPDEARVYRMIAECGSEIGDRPMIPRPVPRGVQ